MKDFIMKDSTMINKTDSTTTNKKNNNSLTDSTMTDFITTLKSKTDFTTMKRPDSIMKERSPETSATDNSNKFKIKMTSPTNTSMKTNTNQKTNKSNDHCSLRMLHSSLSVF